ncbi:MAG: hypothetical protein L0216_04000 [Planctomycetales bacterium]|nr:hypothetical protein [Planctomycetales bacterium]
MALAGLLSAHLEKLAAVAGAGVAALALASSLGGRSAVLAEAAEASAAAEACGAALGAKGPDARGSAGTPAGEPFAPPAAPETAGRWTFSRRPTLKVEIQVQPDTRKRLLPPRAEAAAADFVVTLKWTDDPDSTAAVKAYRVYRRGKGAARPAAPASEVPSGTREWKDSDRSVVKAEATLVYEVAALTDEENQTGKPESDPSAPVEVTLPADREILYYGARMSETVAIVKIRLFHEGHWHSEEFLVKSGEAIGGKKKVAEPGGGDAEADFATGDTFVRAEKLEEMRRVPVLDEKGQPVLDKEGNPRMRMVPFSRSWIVVRDPDGKEREIAAVAAPKDTAVHRLGLDPVMDEIRRFAEEIAATKDPAQRKRLDWQREQLRKKHDRWWNESARKFRVGNLDEDIQEYQDEVAKAKTEKREDVAAELESFLEILKKLREKAGK